MKTNSFYTLLMALSLSACMSVPPDTINLSKTIGRDLVILQDSHRNMAEMQFAKIKSDINTFIDSVYAPFIINFVLKEELQFYKKGEISIYGSIDAAGKIGGDKEIKQAVEDMFYFQESNNKKIAFKRAELLGPILAQEAAVLASIKQSYENLAYGNAAVTNYLESIQKMKQTQGNALERVGLKDMTDKFNSSFTSVSSVLSNVVQQGMKIDINSATAREQINDVSNQIKNLGKNN